MDGCKRKEGIASVMIDKPYVIIFLFSPSIFAGTLNDR